MSHFIGFVGGKRGELSRLGNKTEGVAARVYGTEYGISVKLFHEHGRDRFDIAMVPHPTNEHGITSHIADGLLGEMRSRPHQVSADEALVVANILREWSDEEHEAGNTEQAEQARAIADRLNPRPAILTKAAE